MINLHAYCTVCKSEIPLFNSNAGNAIKINSNVACCGIEIIVTRKRKQIEAPKFAIENIATIKAKKTINSRYQDYLETIPSGRIFYSKKVKKAYKVTVNYIHLKEKEAGIKRGILESLLKKV